MTGSVTVRMYNVGFGDAFVVTVTRGGTTWRMLVDCGVHNQGQARPIRQSVRAIIADLRAASDGVPRLDVVVATHRHADHISGFALDEWEEVEVGEVWLPYVANEDDPDAKALRHPESARRLLGLIEQRTSLRLHQLGNDAGLLTAASTPGDAQFGPWEHILTTESTRAMLADAAFYKVGHHGSHNATPRRFVEEVWQDGGHAMVPYGRVERWQDTIPKRELMEALRTHHHTVTRADTPERVPDIVVQDDLWTELTLTTA